MHSDLEIEGWDIIQVEIKFTDGMPVSEKAVYEHRDKPRKLRARKISFNEASDGWEVSWDTVNEVP